MTPEHEEAVRLAEAEQLANKHDGTLVDNEIIIARMDLAALIAEVDQRARRDEREKCAQECSAGAAAYEGMGFDKQAQALRSTSSLIRARLEEGK